MIGKCVSIDTVTLGLTISNFFFLSTFPRFKTFGEVHAKPFSFV